MNRFTKLTTTLTNPTINKLSKLEMICKTTAQTISGADRVSLWRFCPQFECIECTLFFDAKTKTFSSGLRLDKSEYETYFSAILKNELVVAPNARTHEVTKCFTEGYFKPFNIYSLLDVILFEDFKPAGIVCCESVENVTEWTEENVADLQRIARASSMYLK